MCLNNVEQNLELLNNVEIMCSSVRCKKKGGKKSQATVKKCYELGTI